MTTVTLEEAQAALPDILHRLQPGEEVTITDHGQPMALVKKADAPPQPRLRPPPGLGKGMITVVSDDDCLLDFPTHG